MKKRFLFLLPLLVFSFGCQKYYLAIYQERIDQDSLASSHVGTPDPRQKNPPRGQELILEWQIPQEILLEKPSLHLDVIYRDYSEAHFVYPISYKAGHETYFLLDEEHKKKKGLLAYKGEIRAQDGSVYRSWEHRLWVSMIRLEEEPEESLEEAPVHTDDEDEEEESATFFPPTS